MFTNIPFKLMSGGGSEWRLHVPHNACRVHSIGIIEAPDAGGISHSGLAGANRAARVGMEGNFQRSAANVSSAGAIASVSGCGLRYALSAPHQARRRAPLRPQPETEPCKNNQMQNHEKGTLLTRQERGHFKRGLTLLTLQAASATLLFLDSHRFA